MDNLKIYKAKEIIIVLFFQLTITLLFKEDMTYSGALIYNILFAILPFMLLYEEDDFLKKLGFSSISIFDQIILGIVFGLVFALFVFFYYAVFFSASSSPSQHINFMEVLAFLLFQLIVAFGEEVYFRGYIFRRLSDLCIFNLTPVLITALLFGMSHYIIHGNIYQFYVSSLFGFFAIVLHLKVKNYSMLSLIISHFVYNLCCLLLFPF